MRSLLVLCCLSFALTAPVSAESPSVPPPEVTRTLRTFDFEERRFGNLEDLPLNWVKVQGDNLPHYVNGKLDSAVSRNGKYSFRFDLNGGGLVYRYDAGQIKVRSGAHYRV